MAKNYNKEALIADHKTGAYTQRQLAHKYDISNSMVAKIVKGIPKELEQLVSADVYVKHTLASKSKQEVSAINEVVSRELTKKLIAAKIDDYLDDALEIAARVGVRLLNSDDVSMQDVAQFGKFQNDARVGLKTQDKFSSASTVINNTNAQQNNHDSMTDKDLDIEIDRVLDRIAD